MLNMSNMRMQPMGMMGVLIRLRGTGAAAPAIEVGPHGKPAVASATSGLSGATITRAATGDYTLTINERPGVFMGLVPLGYGVSTPSAVTPRFMQYEEDTAFSGTGRTIRLFHVTPATDAAAAAASDMATTDQATFILLFLTIGTSPT